MIAPSPNQSEGVPLWALGLLALVLSVVALLALSGGQPALMISNWSGPRAAITGAAEPITGEAVPVSPYLDMLRAYNRESVLLESAAGGGAEFLRRDVPSGGTLLYVAVMLDERTHVRVINADGQLPGSDATGDTVWRSGGQHLATVQEMVGAPYAARPGYTLLGATNFSFFGARTSSEGTVVIDGEVLRVNPWRSALCLKAGGQAEIGLFDAARAAGCAQAVGAGPVLMKDRRIVHPDPAAVGDEFIGWNPLGENFVQMDWRITSFVETHPKTTACVGPRGDGGSFLVLATSYGMPGVEVLRHMRAMGCIDAIGADNDTSTQMVWRGAPVIDRPQREVPDALGIYVRD
jgi:hypothetical protein